MAEGNGAERGDAAARDGKPHQERHCDAREEAGCRGDDREPGHDDRDEEGREPDVADLLLEEAYGEKERGVALPVRRREARERDPRGERERGTGDQRVRDAMRKSPAHVECEEEPDQGEDREEVALLDPVGAVGRVERRLEGDGEGDERAEDGESELPARARLPQREGKAHQRAGDEHPAGRVEEQHPVRAHPAQDREGRQVEADDVVVVAEHASGPGDEDWDEAEREEPEHEPLLPEAPA